MKRFFSFILLSMFLHASFAQEVPLLGNIYGRSETVSLNGSWRYIVDVQEEGFYDYRMKEFPNGFFRDAHQQSPLDLVEYNFDTSELMNIPGDWNSQDRRLFFYEGTLWFRQQFSYQPKPHKRAILYFGAVNYEAVVYVNGKKMGRHEGGFTPFNFDVTDALHDGVNNVILKVNNTRRLDGIPTNIFDWWNYGGITRDVMLTTVDDTYIQDYSLQLDKKNWSHISGWIQLNSRLAGVSVEVSIPELKVRQQVVTGVEGRAQLSFKAKPVLWCPENPKLYDVRISRDSEVLTDKIGFRCIETRGKQILLNGKHIFLKGVSIHEEAPFRQGRAHTTEDAHTLLSWAKDMGCNYVRLAHYPHNELAVREAERMGIMVWSEIPCYWTIDWTNPSTYANAERQLNDMISRDHNRAAIIIWSIANETPHSEPRDAFLTRLAKYARTMDNTRLISMAMEVTSAENYHNVLHDNLNTCVDVVSFNQYIGWYRDVQDAPKMTWEIPYDKPVIVSEFGGGARYNYHADKNTRWSEEFQEELYRESLKMMDKIDGLSGLSPWILVDFRSPRRVLPDIQDYFNRKGLISDQGQKKKAFYVMKEYYSNK